MSGEEIPIEELLGSLGPDWDTSTSNRDAGMLGVSIINWRTLTDDEAPAAWQDLGDWVNWFVRRYSIPVRRIPSCWYRHPELVEELSALHTAWVVSFDPIDAGYGPIGWHERLSAAIPRLQAWYNGECHDGHNDQFKPVANVDRNDWNTWIRTSHAN